MLDKTPLKDREPFDLVSLAGLDSWMNAVTDIYAMERDYDNEHDRLNALKKYISRPNPKDHTFLALFVFGEIPDSWTYVELRSRLLTIIAKGIADSYKNSKVMPTEYVRSNIERFFESITTEKQDAAELCDQYKLTWDTVKNFSRHDLHAKGRGIVKSKTDKLTKITYVYRDINKRYYGRVDTHNTMAFMDDLLREYSWKEGDLDLDSFD